MRLKCSCGFLYCIEDGTASYCQDYTCIEKHNRQHNNWLDVMGIFLNPVPFNQTTPNFSINSTTSLPIKDRFPYILNAKRCSICEEQINVTNHVCKAQEKTIDVYDLIIDIGKRGNP